MVSEKAVPLHPLSPKKLGRGHKRKSSLRDLHKQTSSTRSEYFYEYLGN